jgi:hypothetical protein
MPGEPEHQSFESWLVYLAKNKDPKRVLIFGEDKETIISILEARHAATSNPEAYQGPSYLELCTQRCKAEWVIKNFILEEDDVADPLRRKRHVKESYSIDGNKKATRNKRGPDGQAVVSYHPIIVVEDIPEVLTKVHAAQLGHASSLATFRKVGAALENDCHGMAFQSQPLLPIGC